MSTESIHIPVLLHEIVEYAPGKTRTYLDGTLGGAGHALAIAKEFEGDISIIGFDKDPDAITRAEKKLAGAAKSVTLEHADFRTLGTALAKRGIQSVDYILLDLGISSDELDASGRGFSFQSDEPLHMTMEAPDKAPFTAKDIVNGWKEEDIANVVFAYGEERYARRIAKAIVSYREKKSIETTMSSRRSSRWPCRSSASRQRSTPRRRPSRPCASP